MRHLKNIAFYVVILLTGLAIGYAVPRLLRPLPYDKGDYSTYFPDKNVRVVVYGTKDCPFCQQARSYFDTKGIRYVFLDVQDSTEAASQHARLGGGGVPAILIGGRRIRGFWPEEIDKALAQ